jgi:hypothetical protein
MPTIREGIYDLLGSVEIDTKEEGRCHVEPWPSQRMVIDTICKGLSEGVHEFVVLKSRQMAITTVASVIELFWALTNPGTQGAIIADRTDNLERLRRIFASLLETLPREWRAPEHRLTQNNRNGMAFQNRSVIDLLAAGSNPDLGASRALNMMHATECSLWRSLSGVESLKASLARQNPNRLYVWESVASGFNWFHKFCEQAKTDRHMRFVFVGFWANPTYAIPKTDPDFQVYWDGSLMDDEITRARYVKKQYGVVVKPEQVAWWRREAEYSAEEYMLRHYPWTERECFIASGSGFFPAKATLEIGEALAPGPPYQGYRYLFEESFLASRIEKTRNRDEVSLKVWEPPKPEGVYVIGVDPSGGGGGDADDHAIEVFRCYADRLVQVAEYQSNGPLTYQLAWVLSHLCGAYRDHVCNLEVTGIGAAVLPEVRNLRRLAEQGIIQGDLGSEKILDMIGCVRWFLYQRPDTLGGVGNVFAWKTNSENKQYTFSQFRDLMLKGDLELKSINLVTQLQSIVDDEGWIGAAPDTGENDDLACAAVIAAHAYIWQRRDGLISRKLTWESINVPPPQHDMSDVLRFAFSQKMQQVNRNARSRREKF